MTRSTLASIALLAALGSGCAPGPIRLDAMAVGQTSYYQLFGLASDGSARLRLFDDVHGVVRVVFTGMTSARLGFDLLPQPPRLDG